MNYSWTRHYQRYEYLTHMGYINKRVVADLGCGMGYGTQYMGYYAKKMYGVDNAPHTLPYVYQQHKDQFIMVSMHMPSGNPKVDTLIVCADLFNFNEKVDVCVAIELFEHMKEPEKLIAKMSELGEYAFVTTPMVLYTCGTPNKEHVAEYSNEDFVHIIESKFKILKMVYQLGDLSIVNEAVPTSHSMSDDHVVQMAWCKRK